jgi:general secretion pathway protein A
VPPSERPTTNPERESTTPQQPPSRSAPIAAFPAPPDLPPPGGSPGRRRPLIDLFPLAPREIARPPDRLLGMSPGPRLPRTRPVPVPAAPASPQDELTYETFYGLHEKPFNLSPDPKFLYHSASHDRAAQEILDSIRRHDGLVVVTGASGIGKTTLCRGMIEQLDRRTLTSFLSDPSVSVEDLLKTLLADVGAISKEDLARGPLARASRQELTDTLRSFVGSLAALQASAVVIIDDAHKLSLEVLEQIRALVDSDGASRVMQIALVGQPHLVETLARSELRPLAQRITRRVELAPLLADEIAGYVMHRLAMAGTGPRVEFDDGAMKRVFELSRGVPRLVNLICDRALTLGYELSASVIDDDLVEAAAKEIEVTPADSKARRVLRFVAAALVLTLLMLVGAMAAAFVFRSQLSRALVQWQAIPQAPGGPAPRVPVPLAPIPQPPS